MTNLNLIHVETCKAKTKDFREISFIKNVKKSVESNPLAPIQQLYDRERAKENERSVQVGISAPVLPDYVGRKDRFIRLRNKDSNKNPLSLSEVVVPETNTTYDTNTAT